MEKKMFAPDAPGELGEDMPNPDMLRRPTMRREAQSTSALEDTFEPLETVLDQDYEVGEDKSGLSESMREVLNYLDAAECGIGQIQSGHPISLPLVRELQKLLVKGTKSDNPQAGGIYDPPKCSSAHPCGASRMRVSRPCLPVESGGCWCCCR